jgi:hypothetical protein
MFMLLKTLWRFARNRNILNVILKKVDYDLALLEEFKFDFPLTMLKCFLIYGVTCYIIELI